MDKICKNCKHWNEIWGCRRYPTFVVDRCEWETCGEFSQREPAPAPEAPQETKVKVCADCGCKLLPFDVNVGQDMDGRWHHDTDEACNQALIAQHKADAPAPEPPQEKPVCSLCGMEADELDGLGKHRNYRDGCFSALMAKVAELTAQHEADLSLLARTLDENATLRHMLEHKDVKA